MKYVKSSLIITMLLGALYADCDPSSFLGWNCDCNEDTWQDYYNSEGHNMEGCYLAGVDLEVSNLSFANLSFANLTGASLMGVNLTGADLTWAELQNANLAFANLSFANLVYANLTGADLWETNLCNLTGSGTSDDCAQISDITDDNGDGYDDVSYDAGFSDGAGVDYSDGYDAGYDDGVESVECGGCEEFNCILCEEFNCCEMECPPAIIDTNEDGYDDVSYDAGATSGDLNLDGQHNVLDIVMGVNMILNP
jgi:uncharacterized protein YjbI with pentapeptide repeats